MNIAIGSDHAGFELKKVLLDHFKDSNHSFVDKGTYSSDSADYADFAHPVSNLVEDGVVQFGILICGSANGVAMAANKHAGIRCAVCWLPEIASLARAHNDANIVAIPSRFVNVGDAIEIVENFLKTSFEGGRHAKRVNKIAL